MGDGGRKEIIRPEGGSSILGHNGGFVLLLKATLAGLLALVGSPVGERPPIHPKNGLCDRAAHSSEVGHVVQTIPATQVLNKGWRGVRSPRPVSLLRLSLSPLPNQ